jgi:uncharacterized protein (TIGR01777 family)
MKVGVTGASGSIGRILIPLLESSGHEIVRFVRREPKEENEAYWNPNKRTIDLDIFQEMDAVIHLAGEPIAPLTILDFLPFSGQRWTKEKRSRIYWTRKQSAETIIEAYKNSTKYPGIFISASAVGIYGSQGDEIIDENSGYVRGTFDQYVAEEAWESSLDELKDFNVRIVFARTGIALGPDMPIVEILKFVWKLNIGGSIGGGNQYWPWISIEDVVNGYLFSLENSNIKGPVNLVAPTPTIQKDFSKLLSKEMNKIAILPIPAFAVRLALGTELAEALVLGSRRVLPSKLLRYGYKFKHEYLKNYIKEIV